MTGTTPTYIEAIRKLNTTQTGFKILRERIQSNHRLNNEALEQMRNWVQCLGYSINELDRLNIVHVAGTKGKGTTCAYVDSILQKYRLSYGAPQKIGLYTSPHLTTVRERIQINSEPISEEKFAKYFFEVWNALELAESPQSSPKPSYFRFLTLMSFHVFMREAVNTAIYEVGVGGELDSTNIIPSPAVAGITTLGIDHVTVLGDTIDKIAWHKAGIFKKGCPAFTVPQIPQAIEVLQKRAAERGAHLSIVEELSAIRELDIKPAESFQRKNASLAVKLAGTVLKRLGIATSCEHDKLPALVIQGLESFICRGRCQTLDRGQQRWYLDGAHTQESLEVACSWFGRESGLRLVGLRHDSKIPWSVSSHLNSRNFPRVLVFNQQSSRDAISLLKTLHRVLYRKYGVTFKSAIFCTNITRKEQSCDTEFINQNIDPDALQKLTLQKELALTWKGLDPESEVVCLPSIEDAVNHAKAIYCKNREEEVADVFVTGSFHLVGGVLSIIEEPQKHFG